MTRNLLATLLFLAASSAGAATITVNSLNDASGCSLRNAILAANTDTVTGGCVAGEASGDTITIAVAGTYSPTTALPTTVGLVTISNATLGSFVLDGSSAGAAANGLTLNTYATVRGLVIQNFSGSGIEIRGWYTTVAGNRIGTDAAGTVAAPNCTGVGNAGGGIHIVSPTWEITDIEIGGPTNADRNVISGNQCSGILIEANQAGSAGATMEGNYIGTNYCGCDALPNTGYGVQLEGAHAYLLIGSQYPFTTICNGRCNVIASNVLGQIRLNGASANILNNVIGANANMTAGLPTDPTVATGDGISVASGGALIDGNVIVRATGAGILFQNGEAGLMTSNRIGATVQGATIPNGIGIRLRDTVNGSITGNTVVANKGAGIWLDGAQSAIVRRNSIGLIGGIGGAPVTPAGNQGGGFRINNTVNQNATNNFIGGHDEPNTIAFNTIEGDGPGVSILSGVSNAVEQNSIYANIGTFSSLVGIDLGGDGPSSNDPCDSDSGPNNRQNAPVLTSATRATGTGCNSCSATRVFGTLVGQASSQYRLEFFANPPGSPTPRQAQGYLGFINVTTDASCNASFVAQLNYYTPAPNATITATATSSAFDTSELSAPVALWGGQTDPRYDANTDGFTDLLLRNYSNGANAAWLLDGAQNLLGIQNLAALPNTDYHLESSFYLAGQGDNRNILWRNYVTGANAIWTMASGASFPTAIIDLPALPNPQYSVAGTADFDGDGFTDILWRNNTTGAVAVWLMNGTSYAATVDLPTVPLSQWTIAGAGDFNDDGRADIVWHNTSTAANAIWFMDGTTYQSTLNIQSIPNTAYVISAIADYNNDHHPDIVWHNTSTGANAIWLMNGTTLSTIANLPTVPNTNIVPSGPK